MNIRKSWAALLGLALLPGWDAKADPAAEAFEKTASATEQGELATAKQPPPTSTPREVNVQALMDYLAVAPKDQTRLLAQIKRLGGRFELGEEAPSKPAVTLIFADNAVEDGELDCLKGLRNLRGLSLRGFLVTDAALAHAAGLTRLQRLDLNFTGVTSAGLKRLKDMKELRTLNLDGSFLVTDAGLAHVKGLASLRELGLTFTRATDAGVEDLQKTRPNLHIRRRYAHRPARKGETDSAKARLSISLQGPPDNRDEQRGSRPNCLLGFSVAKGVYDHPDERWTVIVKETHAKQIGQVLDFERSLAARPDDSRAWRLQSWALSYNLSCNLRYVRDRYYWVKQGIIVLIEAAKTNPRNPTFLSDVGWFVSHRIGRGDDAREFRRMFADDTELQEILIAGFPRDEVLGPTGRPDNWLVAKQWFQKAADRADKERVAIEHKKPLIYLSDAPLCQMYYAIALEEEGRFDQTVKQAWAVAAREWEQYGWRKLPTVDESLAGRHVTIRLNDLDLTRAEETAAIIRRHRELVNFDYWRLRAQAEQSEEVLAARRAIYRADQDFKAANLQPAKENYEKGLAAWRRALDALPAIARDGTLGLELIEVIRRYRRVLKQRDEPFPKPFILQDVLDLHERDQNRRAGGRQNQP